MVKQNVKNGGFVAIKIGHFYFGLTQGNWVLDFLCELGVPFSDKCI